eukprot:scaffold81899_cov37-Tisochrysis_lutea.AAC.2
MTRLASGRSGETSAENFIAYQFVKGWTVLVSIHSRRQLSKIWYRAGHESGDARPPLQPIESCAYTLFGRGFD